MKKFILLSLLFSTYFLNAQNWMPFNHSDDSQHYVSETGISNGISYSFRPIQTVAVKAKSIIGSNAEIKFKKGFNFQRSNSYLNQKIKGQMLGDSCSITATSSTFFSTDSNGFILTFPHQYKFGDSFTIGISNKHYILASVDSLFIDSINGVVDSIAFVNQQVYTNTGNRDTSHFFDKSHYIISKINGLIKAVNYTELNISGYFHRYYVVTDTITEGQNLNLSSGDEIHWTTYNTQNPFPSIHETTISIVDSININNRIKTFFFTHLTRITWDIASPFNQTHSIISIDTAKTYTVLRSNIIEDTSLTQWHQNVFDVFGLDKGQLNRLRTYSPTLIGFPPFVAFDSINASFVGGLAGNNSNRIIGLWGESKSWGYNGCGACGVEVNVQYYKIGNHTWGSPYNRIVLGDGILNENYSFKIYPNPSSNKLNLKTNKSFDLIEIRNIRGQIVFDHGFKTQIDVSDLPSGIYFIKLIGEDIVSQKFIKN